MNYEVSITIGVDDADSPEEAVRHMIEWLTVYGGATNGSYVITDMNGGEAIVIDAEDLK